MLAKLLLENGRLENLRSNTAEARKSFTMALELMRTAKGERDPEVGSILSELSNILVWSDDLAAAEIAARSAVERRHVTPAELGERRIGHFGFFSAARSEDLWKESREWLLARA